jgi:hypothetical protein
MSTPQCKATSKRTGIRCQKHARTGFPVCEVHGAGKGAKRGGRPPKHGAYTTKFLRPEQVEDFEYFRQHFSLDDDLAFAATKAYHAVESADVAQLARILEVPSKIAERRKRILEGVTLKLDVDTNFIRGFVAKVMEHVTDPAAQADIFAYLRQHMGDDAV